MRIWDELMFARRLRAGLHTYAVERPRGEGEMRIHLRVEEGGNGILFVDVTDVIHLNKTALLMAKMALEGVPRRLVKVMLAVLYRGAIFRGVGEGVERMYGVIEHLTEHSEGCTTCALTGMVQQAPLFSVKVNAPYKVDLALTYGCNNECPHCYNEVGRLAMPSLPKADWFKVLDKLAELGVPHLILTGGEATLHPDLAEIIRYADGLGMIVGLNTNGRALGQESTMRKLAEAGLNHVQVTLGSCYAEVHDLMMGADSFEQTVRGIKTAVDSGVHVITNTTLMRSNMDHAEEIIEFLDKLGIRTFAMNGMIYSGGGFAHPNALMENELGPLLMRVKNHAEKLGMRFLWYTPTEYCKLSPVELEIGAKRCNAGEYSMCIEPNGDVLPCQSYYVTVGNILEDAWEEIWESELFRSFRERGNSPEENGLPEMCWDCPELALCGGGCRIEREARLGIRTADGGGGGCAGCTGFSGSVEGQELVQAEVIKWVVPEGGYVPPTGQINVEVRSSGVMPVIKRDDGVEGGEDG